MEPFSISYRNLEDKESKTFGGILEPRRSASNELKLTENIEQAIDLELFNGNDEGEILNNTFPTQPVWKFSTLEENTKTTFNDGTLNGKEQEKPESNASEEQSEIAEVEQAIPEAAEEEMPKKNPVLESESTSFLDF